MNWTEAPFEQLYAMPSKNGLTRPASVRGTGYKMINMGELFAHDRIGDLPMERVQLNEKELASMLVEPGDLLFARQSLVLSGAGKCSIVREVSEPTTFESHIIRVRLKVDVADPQFFHYYFKSPTSGIRAIVTQGVQAGIRGSDLKRLVIRAPPIDEQRRIAFTISAYDDLIENNHSRIELLGQSARLLYREWFVHLRFPGHEHVRVIDGVPKGWDRKRVEEVAEINARSLPSKHEGEISYIDIASVTTGSINETTAYNCPEAPGRARRIVRHGDMIWSCVRPNRASYAAVWKPKPDLIASTGFCVLSPVTVPPTYLYYALSTQDFIGYLTNNARGAAYPAVVSGDFGSYQVLVPAPDVLEAFREATEASFDLIEVLKQQNHQLRQARDLLLPRLMSGEVAV